MSGSHYFMENNEIVIFIVLGGYTSNIMSNRTFHSYRDREN